jgi:beta-lactamase class A
VPWGSAIGRLSGGPLESAGELASIRSWSTMKVPVIVAAMQEGRAQQEAVEAAITRSDNDAALFVWEELGGDDTARASRVDAVLRQAGDDATSVVDVPDPRGFSPFGRTVWSLAGAATFYRSLATGELLSPTDTDLILDAMGRVVADQRWGVGAAAWDAAPPLRFKGGWGPSESDSGGHEVLQVGLIGEGEDGVVIAIAATAPDHGAATEAATRVAQEIARLGHPHGPQGILGSR